ncbi:MAG: elongation factor P [bacterium]
MLSLNEIKLGKVVQINKEPFVVIRAEQHAMGRGSSVLKTKLKNLISGNVMERTWQGNDKAEEANVIRKKSNYLYKDDTDAYLMDNENFEQFNLPLDQLDGKDRFLKEDTEVLALYFNDKPVAIDLPIKIELKVVSAPPGVKGNSAGNVNKTVELETGATIQVPMFVNEGDTIRVNTETEEYAERVM